MCSLLMLNENSMKFTKTHPIQTAVFCPLPLNAGDLGRTEQFSILSDERVVTNNDVDIVWTLKRTAGL